MGVALAHLPVSRFSVYKLTQRGLRLKASAITLNDYCDEPYNMKEFARERSFMFTYYVNKT
jgi:hypothetical protein